MHRLFPAILCGALWLLLPCTASAVPPVFSLDVGAGISSGTVREYVLQSGQTISRIDWSTDCVPELALRGSVSWRPVWAQIQLTSAIPVSGGSVQDFDFLTAGSAIPSQYSRHTLYLDKSYSVSGSVGFAFSAHGLSLCSGAGFLYRNQKWTAQDGYLQYPTSGVWTGGEPKTEVNGMVLSYEQSVLLPEVQLAIGYIHPEGTVTFLFGGSVFPCTVVTALDTHHLRSRQFYDSMQDGFGWSLGTMIRIRHAVFSARYEKFRTAEGTSASGDVGAGGSLQTDDKVASRVESERITLLLSLQFATR